MKLESQIQDEIRLALGKDPDVALFRNNVGVADVYNPSSGMTTKLRFGLCVGSSDLIGIVRVEVRGIETGRFFALEVKTPTGSATEEQVRFLNLVRKFGGFAAIVTSKEEARAAVERCKKGLDQ